METINLGKLESEFADIIWAEEPVESGMLAAAAAEKFGWKKSTAYTVLKRLCNKGLFVNENGVVRALIGRDEFYSQRSVQTVDNEYHGSLPAFVAAFTRGRKLSGSEIEKLQKLIDEYREK